VSTWARQVVKEGKLTQRWIRPRHCARARLMRAVRRASGFVQRRGVDGVLVREPSQRRHGRACGIKDGDLAASTSNCHLLSPSSTSFAATANKWARTRPRRTPLVSCRSAPCGTEGAAHRIDERHRARGIGKDRAPVARHRISRPRAAYVAGIVVRCPVDGSQYKFSRDTSHGYLARVCGRAERPDPVVCLTAKVSIRSQTGAGPGFAGTMGSGC